MKWNFRQDYNKIYEAYYNYSINDGFLTHAQIYGRNPSYNLYTDDTFAAIYSMGLLDLPADRLDKSLYETMKNRKSYHTSLDSNQEINLALISELCAYGLIGFDESHRSYPSGGGLYDVEVNIIFNENKVDKFLTEYGNVCVFNYENKSLDYYKFTPWEEYIRPIFMQEYFVDTAKFAIVMSVNFEKHSLAYKELSYKLALIESGHIGQNIQLASSLLELRTIPLLGFYDADLNKIISEKQKVIYTVLVG